MMDKQIQRLDGHEFEQQAIKEEKETGDLVFQAVAVDKNKRPNRLGFVFDWKSPGDVDVAALRKNPVLIWRHDSDELPVGRIEAIDVGSKRVKMTCRIPGYPELEQFRRWIRDGYLRGVSIGFYIRQAEPRDDDTLRIQKFEIVELSLCSIGAHETALIQQDSPLPPAMAVERVCGDDSCRQWEEGEEQGRKLYRLSLSAPESEEAATYTCECVDCGYQMESDKHCRELTCPKCGGQMRRAERPGPGQGAPEPAEQAARWKAIPYSRHGDCPTADEGKAWDGPKAIRDATPEQLMRMCLFEDADNPDVKAGYKLPHHLPGDNKPTVVWNGVRAAMGVLLGARGGVKGVSVDEKKKGYSHLVKHYGQFGKEAPEFRQDFSADELRALHDEGTILIPGVPDKTAPVVAIVEDDRTEQLESQIAELQAEIARLKAEAADKEAAPRQDEARKMSAAEAETLRKLIRIIIRTDPDIQDKLDNLAQKTIADIRKGKV